MSTIVSPECSAPKPVEVVLGILARMIIGVFWLSGALIGIVLLIVAVAPITIFCNLYQGLPVGAGLWHSLRR